jgi:hypothetical protein
MTIFESGLTCPKCGGNLIGDGYTLAIHCEFANTEDYWYNEPDAPAVYCDFDKTEDG